MNKNQYYQYMKVRPKDDHDEFIIDNSITGHARNGLVPYNNFEGLLEVEYGWCKNFRGFIQLREMIEKNKF